MSASAVLRAARKLIETRERWAHGPAELNGGRHCSVTAICFQGRLTEDESWRLLRRAISGTDYDPTISVWNDAPERTHEEVLAAFDRAIELAEAEEGAQA